MLKEIYQNFVISLIVSIFIFSFSFIFKFIDPNYYICNKLKIYKISFFNRIIEINYPISCDQEPYYSAIKNLNHLFSEGYIYQGRPLYIAMNKIFYEFLSSIFININDEIILHVSVHFFHLLVACFSAILIVKIFELNQKLTLTNRFIIISLILLSPLFKWGAYDPSNQTLTLIVLLLTTYVLKFQKLNPKFSLIFGILSLMHRTFLVGFVFILLYNFWTSGDFKNLKKYKSYILNGLIVLIPTVLYNLYIFLQINQTPYDANSSYWGQFIWIIYYFFGSRRFEGLFHCMDIPDFIFCYFVDNIKLFLYLFLPILFLFIYKNFFNFKKNQVYFFSLTSLFFYIFYLFIGWYPPIRFSYYSLGHFIVVISIYSLFCLEKKKQRNLLASVLAIYFLFLNHWNFPQVLGINIFIILSFLVLIVNRIHTNKLKR